MPLRDRPDGPVPTLSLPPPELAERIETCWSFRAEPEHTCREFFPDPAVNLVLRMSDAGARAVLIGPASRGAAVELLGGAEYVGVRFRPGMATRLADVHAAALADAMAEVEVLGGRPVAVLAAELRALPDAATRRLALASVAGVGGFLVRDAQARAAARLLDASGGAARVEEIAVALGLSVRSLERLLRTELGLTPKRLARLVRLRGVMLALASGFRGTLAELAAAHGYADQAHLARDYRELTGRPPGAPGAFRPRRVDPAVPRVVPLHRKR